MRVLDGFVKRLFCCDSAHVMLRLTVHPEGQNIDLQRIQRRIAMEFCPHPVAVDGEAQKDEDGNGRPNDFEEVVAVGIMRSLALPATILDKRDDQNGLPAMKTKSVSQKIKFRMLSICSPPYGVIRRRPIEIPAMLLDEGARKAEKQQNEKTDSAAHSCCGCSDRRLSVLAGDIYGALRNFYIRTDGSVAHLRSRCITCCGLSRRTFQSGNEREPAIPYL